MVMEELLREKQRVAEEIIRKYLPRAREERGVLAEAMRYSMEAGGKRLRPVLMRESFLLFGGRESALIDPFAAALEMIHTHSLIHDDLPALDNDELRRGKKTTHAVYGEAVGILAGDALLNFAYETAMCAFSGTTEKNRVVSALQILSEKSGFRGMLGGQGLDVENEKKHRLLVDRETLDYIYTKKTAALLEAALMIGAVLAGADEKAVFCMEQIGRKTGLAFQIRDDILDVTADEAVLGKPSGSDEKNGKTTYVTLFGVKKAEDEVRRLTEEAKMHLDELPGEHDFLSWLLLRMAGRTY